MLAIYGSGLRSGASTCGNPVKCGWFCSLFYSLRWCLLERSVQITGSMLDGREMIAERHSGNRRRIKRVISGAREHEPRQPRWDKIQTACKDRLPRGWTRTSVLSKARGKQKLTAEGRRCENVNVIVQGPFVEAGLVRLGILDPVLPSTENIHKSYRLLRYKTPVKCVYSLILSRHFIFSSSAKR